MKRIPFYLLLCLAAACDEPEQKDTVATPQDSVAAPAVVRPDSDSQRYKMPVEQIDTNHPEQEMPVAKPEPGVQPK